jgi:hypothetical protein
MSRRVGHRVACVLGVCRRRGVQPVWRWMTFLICDSAETQIWV